MVFAAIIFALFFRVYPLEMQRQIINTAIRLGNQDLLFYYCGLYFGSVIIAAILKYFLNFIQRYIGQKVLIEIRNDLYEHILTLPMQFFRENQPGTMINAMTSELNSVGLFLGSALTTPLLNILTFLAFAGYMVYLNPKLGLISMTIYPVELILIPILQKKYNVLNKKRTKISRGMSSTINEAVTGIHEVQANAAYKLEQEKLKPFVNKLFQIMRNLFIFKFGIKFINSLVQSVGPFFLFMYGGYLAIHGHFTLGSLVAFLSAYEKLYDPWKEMVEYYQEYQDAAIRYKQIIESFSIESEYDLLPIKRKPHSFLGKIEVKNLDYIISGGVKLLSNVSFDIDPGQHTALVGFSGSGKSTLALLLGQMYSYSNGSIKLDGYELSTLTKADISKNIGFVAQHPFIFTGTIRENLLYSINSLESIDPDTKNKQLPCCQEIIKIIEKIGFNEDVIRLGLNTVVEFNKWEPLIPSFIKIRHALSSSNKAQLCNLVEPFSINKFMQHNTIYENLIFGEFHDDNFKPDHIIENSVFIDFIKKEGLYNPLIILGKTLTVQTVNLLKDFAEDDFFLKSTPIHANDFEKYSQLADRLEALSSNDFDKKDIILLLNLALKYIPVVHHNVSIPKTMEDKIVQTRHKFMIEIGGANIDRCITMTEEIHEKCSGGCRSEKIDFFPYCPSQYQHSHSLLDNILFGNLKYSSLVPGK